MDMKKPIEHESEDLMRNIKTAAQDFYADNLSRLASTNPILIETAVMIGASLAIRATPGQRRALIADCKTRAHQLHGPVPKDAPKGVQRAPKGVPRGRCVSVQENNSQK
jgi:hypothetical protein